MPSRDPLHARIVELMDVTSNLTIEEKNQLANDLRFIITVVKGYVDTDPLSLNLALECNTHGEFRMLFVRDDQFILGRITNTRNAALDGLRRTVEELIDVFVSRNSVKLLV